MEYTKYQKEILDRLENFIQEQGSQNKASKMLGFSTSTISTLRKGTYDGNVDMAINKLAEYFGVKEEQLRVYSEIEYTDTSISHEIYSIISDYVKCFLEILGETMHKLFSIYLCMFAKKEIIPTGIANPSL